MIRREFLVFVGGAAAWSMAAWAQDRGRVKRIGILTAQADNDPAIRDNLVAFAKGLNSFGWSEGRNLRIKVIRYAVEVLPATSFLGAYLEANEERFDSQGIRELYDSAEYPLPRLAN